MNHTDLVIQAYEIFSDFDFPKNATDIKHCHECADQNNEINGAGREELTAEQIGTVCWGILPFLVPEAMGYYMPRFIELAVSGENNKENEPFMVQYINQIGLNADSDQFRLFSAQQRALVQQSLQYLKNHYLDVLVEYCCDDEIDQAIDDWAT